MYLSGNGCGHLVSAEEKIILLSKERDNLRAELAKAQGSLDLMRDEFKRINSITKSSVDWHNASEIQRICERAIRDIAQTIPVIRQRDKLEAELAKANFFADMAAINEENRRLLEADEKLAHLVHEITSNESDDDPVAVLASFKDQLKAALEAPGTDRPDGEKP